MYGGKKFMIKNRKIFVCLMLVFLMMLSTTVSALSIKKPINQEENIETEFEIIEFLKTKSTEIFDNPSTVEINFTVKEIRALSRIDLIGDPDFYVIVNINGIEKQSPVWENQKYITEEWSTKVEVSTDEEFIDIRIELWDKRNFRLRDQICDISPNNWRYTNKCGIDLLYSLKSGHWLGDDCIQQDWFYDLSGYGRLNGYDDNSYYEKDRDCEMWFDISLPDPDGDGIPTWTEEEIFGTDPTMDDTGRDDDNDGIPIEWENKWGHRWDWNWHSEKIDHEWEYDPFIWDNHENLDPDNDGLNNYEEYLTSQWGSDPFIKDLFIEMDQMRGPDGGAPHQEEDGVARRTRVLRSR